MRRFLSWDCGNKTLAHAHVTVNTFIFIQIGQFEARLSAWMKKYVYENVNPIEQWIRGGCADTPAMIELFSMLNEIKYAMKTFITFHSVGVNDILEGKKVADTDEVERTVALAKFLEASPVSLQAISREDNIYHFATEVIIEHQPSKVGMATNNKSTMVGHQLMFYYVGRVISLVSPKLKNQISLPGIVFSPTYGGASTPYYARKKHSKDMFLQLMKVFDMEYVYSQIPLSCMDDLADAVMQIIAYCKDKKLFAKVA
jgi:Poxvirus A22 protein